MIGFRERAAEGLQVGDSFRSSRIFTDDDIIRFAHMSRDYNPVHFDTRFAQARNFPAPICHGLLAASLSYRTRPPDRMAGLRNELPIQRACICRRKDHMHVGNHGD
jgi:acyl dehydratase